MLTVARPRVTLHAVVFQRLVAGGEEETGRGVGVAVEREVLAVRVIRARVQARVGARGREGGGGELAGALHAVEARGRGAVGGEGEEQEQEQHVGTRRARAKLRL